MEGTTMNYNTNKVCTLIRFTIRCVSDHRFSCQATFACTCEQFVCIFTFCILLARVILAPRYFRLSAPANGFAPSYIRPDSIVYQNIIRNIGICPVFNSPADESENKAGANITRYTVSDSSSTQQRIMKNVSFSYMIVSFY